VKAYVWYRTTNGELAQRAADLINKAWGSPLIMRREQLNPDDGETGMGQFGTPVGAGSEAGTNPGAAMVESVRSSVISNHGEYNARLTQEERFDLLLFITEAVDIHADWWWNDSSPDWPGPGTP
jgi:hypothetical protein